MRYKFNLSLIIDNQETGEVIRNFGADIYLNSLDGCSLDYLKKCIVEACNGAINNINDM
ncbi:hypothetical protein B0H39_002492 [Clostridium beijerinckii]|uniref:hypothetical protein n=1 Tax=Clostridium beijerinckii TaxID=1520 RepID=UPI00149445E2|nr:hypothetical protein [Clostridium beijerinckii]NOW84596.1 hypothetical protein [Clostridium beijerinckii]NOW84611.1 hypothetical protein [Clostridium beijerinckii]